MRKIEVLYQLQREHKEATNRLPQVKAASMTTEEWKKARRREQCRLSQARHRERKRIQESQARGEMTENTGLRSGTKVNYWKRKRLLTERLAGEMTATQQAIRQLQMQKAMRGQHKEHIVCIETFHCSLQTGIRQQQLPDVQNYQLMYGCTPALQVLSDLQREEFDSMESLRLHWLWYRSQFREFELSITSYECLKAGEHVVIKATGDLRMGIGCNDDKQREKSQTIVCPVLQQFEFEVGEQVMKRITSEVDLVGGMAKMQKEVDPERILNTLRCLSEAFCRSNDDNKRI
ncbi:hypothetical protein G195_009039 [Phytophthora kernoviae 00238/432]|uniref:Uncharacterized protein n=1 Tax=Phytophthora kernoviae 00238/432 TaxID=1284355 RepID=A0A8J4S635_9STRA|nr:hypothetical protein G195_009039 [Phytophthora kernoviae 00238/432]